MTTDKDFKRVVRARMQKTGESYTAARAAVSRKSPPVRRNANAARAGTVMPPVSKDAAPDAAPADFARLAGMSDEAVAARTGCTWEKWVWALDHSKAYTWSHAEIARFVGETYKVTGWWAQMVTVGYERLTGRRRAGETKKGYAVSASRTVGVSRERAFAAFDDLRLRRRWLPEKDVTIHKTTAPRSARITWRDGTKSV
ncbi:MAG TPA: hypothetical protein VFV33_06520, partial [Gemmatimonadaceae bacterium]|nr:hypothetical protein [Gemmatimonadaceae bacterium]